MEGKLRATLIDGIDDVDLAEAKEHAWSTAASTGTGQTSAEHPRKAVAMVPHTIGDRLTDLEIPPEDRLAAGFDMYEELPSYTILMYIRFLRKRLDDEQPLWERYRHCLSQEDERLAVPIAYELWCGDFEAEEKVAEVAWNSVLAGEPDRRLIERVLDASGPVPWRLKADLYNSLLPDRSWRRHIYRSIQRSEYDYFGKINPRAAHSLLRKLRIPRSTPGRDELIDRLTSS